MLVKFSLIFVLTQSFVLSFSGCFPDESSFWFKSLKGFRGNLNRKTKKSIEHKGLDDCKQKTQRLRKERGDSFTKEIYWFGIRSSLPRGETVFFFIGKNVLIKKRIKSDHIWRQSSKKFK